MISRQLLPVAARSTASKRDLLAALEAAENELAAYNSNSIMLDYYKGLMRSMKYFSDAMLAEPLFPATKSMSDKNDKYIDRLSLFMGKAGEYSKNVGMFKESLLGTKDPEIIEAVAKIEEEESWTVEAMSKA